MELKLLNIIIIKISLIKQNFTIVSEYQMYQKF